MTDTVTPAPTVPERGTLSGRLPRAWMFPLLPFAATWLLTVTAWFASNAVYRTHLSWVFWLRFRDANIYNWISQSGYGKPRLIVPRPGLGTPFTAVYQRSAFFPLFPGIVRLASYATLGNFTAAQLITVILAGAASAVAVWALADRLRGRRTADRAAVLYCLFPGSMVFGMLYPEPFAAALAAASLLAAVNRRWVTAGVLALLASATEPMMMALALALGVTALHALWTRRDWRSLIAPVLAPLGMLAYFAYYGYRYGDFFFWSRIERAEWHQHIDWGLHELHELTWTDAAVARHPIFNVFLIVTFWIAVAGLVLLIRIRPPLPVLVYTFGVFALVVLSYGAGSRPRLVLLMTGVFIALADRLPKWAYYPFATASAAALFFLIAWWPHNFPPSPLPPPAAPSPPSTAPSSGSNGTIAGPVAAPSVPSRARRAGEGGPLSSGGRCRGGPGGG